MDSLTFDDMNEEINIDEYQTKNIYLNEPQKGLELCSSIVSLGTNRHPELFNEIDEQITKFIDIVDNDENTTGAKAYSKLIALKEDLLSIVCFPHLENSYTISIGGSFSTGKSRFLNTVLGLDELLPTDTNPTTSIPTYIMHGSKNRYYALNKFNNNIPIDSDAIQAISHAFSEKYNATFSHILKLISIEREKFKYSKLIFLDTPGYSKSDSLNSTDNIDENIARNHLRTTDFLIWLVSCQTPIPDADIKFIKSLDIASPILFILSKADQKPENEVFQQINKSRETIEKAGIPIYDVIGFSSETNKEFSSNKNVLKTYLDALSTGKSGTKILLRIEKVFDEYINFYDSRIIEHRETRGVLNDAVMNIAKTNSTISNSLSIVARTHKEKIDILQEDKRKVQQLKKKLIDKVLELMKKSGVNIEQASTGFNLKPVTKNKKNDNNTFRFKASLQMKNKSELTKFSNLSDIKGRVYKVSSIGVSIKIDIDADIYVTTNEVKKTAMKDSKDLFKKDDKVKIQIINEKQCVVII